MVTTLGSSLLPTVLILYLACIPVPPLPLSAATGLSRLLHSRLPLRKHLLCARPHSNHVIQISHGVLAIRTTVHLISRKQTQDVKKLAQLGGGNACL